MATTVPHGRDRHPYENPLQNRIDRRHVEPREGLHEDQSWLRHCYAETFTERFRGVKGHPYEQGFDLRLVTEKLSEPLTWSGPRMVFVNAMSDLFHQDVPDHHIRQVAAVAPGGLAHVPGAHETCQTPP